MSFRLGLAAIAVLLPLPAGAAPNLAALKWKARPVVVLSDTPDDPRAAQQMAALARTGAAVKDRQIAVVREAKVGGALRRRLGIADHGFAVVLVGKDGDVKRVWRAPVAPEGIFGLIGQMPMRRDETKIRRSVPALGGLGRTRTGLVLMSAVCRRLRRGRAFEGLQSSPEVVGTNEVGQVPPGLRVIVVVERH